MLVPVAAQETSAPQLQKMDTKLDTIITKLDEVAKNTSGGAAKVEASAPAVPAVAGVDAEAIKGLQLNINYVWAMLAGALVFIMQAGFAMVELGFARAKNSINIIMKNFLDFCISTIGFLFIGFGLMFGTSWYGIIGTDSFWLADTADGKSPLWVFWFFQVVFAGTACTIVSGAMAERTKFVGYLVYAAFLFGVDLSALRALGLGQFCGRLGSWWRERLAGGQGLCRFCGLVRRACGRRGVRSGGHHRGRTSARPLRQGWLPAFDRRSQHPAAAEASSSFGSAGSASMAAPRSSATAASVASW